jgi:tetratricopeptide (TPR) repeat protein
MRIRLLLPLLLIAIAATPSFASFSGKPESTPSPSSSGTPEASDQKTPRQQAESWYNDAYDDVSKAKDALAGDKPDTKKAQKLFKRAIDRADHALELDRTYFEALNLQGFAWRKLGDYPKSLAAYSACLDLQPEYAPAREYYGEALLESGNRSGAQDQLTWLKKLKADDLAKQLEAAIAAAPATDDKSVKAASTGSSSGNQN